MPAVPGQSPARPAAAAYRNRRAFWLKHLHQWHWISSAICLIGMLLFAATGITLNHAGEIEAKPRVTERTATLPPDLLPQLAGVTQPKGQLPPAVADWLGREFGISAGGREAEWSRDEVYLALPRPGGDGWLTIARDDGAIVQEITDRGWVSYLNDLHKGRNTGGAWAWFLDVFAVACLVFCATGLFLLQFHAGNRPATWPMVGLGLVVPLLLAMLFIH
jgi:hypothetical protein